MLRLSTPLPERPRNHNASHPACTPSSTLRAWATTPRQSHRNPGLQSDRTAAPVPISAMTSESPASTPVSLLHQGDQLEGQDAEQSVFLAGGVVATVILVLIFCTTAFVCFTRRLFRRTWYPTALHLPYDPATPGDATATTTATATATETPTPPPPPARGQGMNAAPRVRQSIYPPPPPPLAPISTFAGDAPGFSVRHEYDAMRSRDAAGCGASNALLFLTWPFHRARARGSMAHSMLAFHQFAKPLPVATPSREELLRGLLMTSGAGSADEVPGVCMVCLEPLSGGGGEKDGGATLSKSDHDSERNGHARTLAAGTCRHWVHAECMYAWLLRDRQRVCMACRMPLGYATESERTPTASGR